MRYIPCTDADCQAMLAQIGVRDVEELFAAVPAQVRLQRELNLPPPLSEGELLDHLRRLSASNAEVESYTTFLGAGAYHHFIPAIVPYLVGRSEFSTPYTPYQPEVSQGTLQALYEYQTLICQLAGMEVANASLYDGASSLAEAILMARRLVKRPAVLVSRAVHPEYRQVVHTYLGHLGMRVVEVPFDDLGVTDLSQVERLMDGEVCALVMQQPNALGGLEDLAEGARLVHQVGGLLIAVVVEALSLGLLRPAGELGADVVCGEGQSLGIPLAYGGPHLGLFATRQAFIRELPGRVVGETTDRQGRRGYVLTLATREQHIRRQRATSNICTNQTLCAIMACIYLSTMGGEGLRQVATLNLQKAHYAREQIASLKGFRLPFSLSPIFNEFVVETPSPPEEVQARLLQHRILAGLPLGRFYPELRQTLLLCVTEKISRAQIDQLCQLLADQG